MWEYQFPLHPMPRSLDDILITCVEHLQTRFFGQHWHGNSIYLYLKVETFIQ